MLIFAIRAFRQHNRLVLNMTIVAAVLFAVQSTLGAIVVLKSLPVLAVSLHLVTALLLLAFLLLAGLAASYRPGLPSTSNRVATLAYTSTALSLVIILTGTLVRGSGATLACTDWPLCNGQILPVQQGSLALIHMAHRIAVIALGISVVASSASSCGLPLAAAGAAASHDTVRPCAVCSSAFACSGARSAPRLAM